MMLSTTAGKQTPLTDTQAMARESGRLASRKIWLPKLIYDALPYFYLVAGFGAFFTTMYISHWFWVLPHYLLFSAACIHLGLLVYRKRRKSAENEA